MGMLRAGLPRKAGRESVHGLHDPRTIQRGARNGFRGRLLRRGRRLQDPVHALLARDLEKTGCLPEIPELLGDESKDELRFSYRVGEVKYSHYLIQLLKLEVKHLKIVINWKK